MDMMGNNLSNVELDNDVIRVTVVGNSDEELTKNLLKKTAQLMRELRSRHQKVLILVDMRKAGGSPDPGTKRLVRGFLRKAKYNRIAIFGGDEESLKIVRYILNTIARVVRVRLFRTEPQGLGWLRRAQASFKIAGRRLLAVTTAITLFAVFWVLLIAPYLLRLPSDFSYDASVISYDNFYNEQVGSYSGAALSNTQFSYRVAASKGDVLDIRNRFDVRTTSGDKIFAVERTYGVDRQTGQHVSGHGDRDREGYLFAPRNLAKQDFVYWHVNYDEPAVMKFQDEETILGLKTYRYGADYHADQTKNLTNLPDVGKTRGVNLDINLQLWIEPVTGQLVKYEDRTTAYYYDLASGQRLNPWNQFNNSYSFDSIAAHVNQAEQARQRQIFIQTTMPILLVLVAIGLIGWWGGLVWRSRRRKIKLLNVWPKAGAITLAGVALTVIVGWATNNITLTRLHPSFSAMHILTAMNFLVFAATLWLVASRKLAWYVRVVALFLLGLILLSQIFYFLRIFFDLRLGASMLLEALKLPSVDHISPVTVLCFLLTVIAMALSLWFKGRIIAVICQSMLLIVLALAIFGIAGYAFSLESLYSIDWFRAMALHSAILFVVLAVSNFALHADWAVTKRVKSTSKSTLLSLGILIALLMITGFVWQQAIGRAASQAELQFQTDANTLETTITSKLGSYINVLQGAGGLFAASNEVSRAEWKAYIDSLHVPQNYSGILGLGFTQMIAPSQKAAHIAEIRRQGFPAYDIRPEGSRDIYSSIIYIEPFNETNQRAFGYDMLSEPVRRAAMEQARDTGEATLSGKVTLVQDKDANSTSGVLLYFPVYKHGFPLTSPEQRKTALLGYVYAAVRVADFMQATVGNQTRGIDIGIFDTPSVSHELTLENRLAVIDSRFGIENQAYTPRFVRIESIPIANRNVTLRFSSLPTYTAGANQTLPVFVLFGGISLSFLLAILAFLLSTSRSRALELANEMTLDLRNERNMAITSQHKDEAILFSIGDGVFVIDPAGRIVLFNKAAELISGYSADEATGQPYKQILRFYSEKDGRPVTNFVDSALRGKRSEMARLTRLKRKDGSDIPVADSAAPIINARGATEGVVVVFRDISRERQLEKMKDEFLSIASHELRTPMGAIRANVSMMLGGDYGRVNKSLIDPLTDVHTSTIRLVDLVNDLLDAARLEADRMKLTLSDFDLQVPLGDTVSALVPLGKEKGIDIVLASGGKSPKVQADPDKLKQVLTNIIGNAVKFTNKGRITISTNSRADVIEVSISDTGIGIPAEERTRLFGKFNQVSSAQAGKPAGTGLGLYISREIMRKMGGDLWLAHSEFGKGSIFMLAIPRTQSAKARVAKEQLEREAKQHPDQK